MVSIVRVVVILVSITVGDAFGQGQKKPESRPDAASNVVSVPIGDTKYVMLSTNENSKKRAAEVFRRSTGKRDSVVYISCDYLYRKIGISNGDLHEPQYEVGSIAEDFSSGDLKTITMAVVPDIEPAKREGSKSFGEAWQKENTRLKKFVKDQQNKPDYLPSKVDLESINQFFLPWISNRLTVALV